VTTKIAIEGLDLDYANPETGATHRAVAGLDLDVAAMKLRDPDRSADALAHHLACAERRALGL